MSTRQVGLQARAYDERTHSPQSTAVLLPIGECPLSAGEFQHLASVPAAVEWCANIDNPRPRRAYQHDLEDFCGFVGLTGADEFCSHPRACWPGALNWKPEAWPAPRSGANWRRWPSCLIIKGRLEHLRVLEQQSKKSLMPHSLAQVGDYGLFVGRPFRFGQVFRPATIFRAEKSFLLAFVPTQNLPGG